MKKVSIKLLTILLILLCFSSIGWAMDLPDYSGDIYVQDFANLISSQLEDDIKSVARSLEDKTSAQIAVVTINSLDGNDIEGYANGLFRKWQLGDKEKENGALFIIAKEEQRFRIEVGYGLEGRINDAKAGDILREIAPHFQEGNFNKGIVIAFNTLVKEISAEYQIEPVQISENQVSTEPIKSTNPEQKSIPFWAKALFVIIFIYLAIFHPDVLMTIIYIFMRNGGRGGGSGGGGYRGGGGGSSGGGGASGRW